MQHSAYKLLSESKDTVVGADNCTVWLFLDNVFSVDMFERGNKISMK